MKRFFLILTLLCLSMCMVLIGCNGSGSDVQTSQPDADTTTDEASGSTADPDNGTTAEQPDNTTEAQPDGTTTQAQGGSDTPEPYIGRFGKYAGGNAGVEDGYVWDEAKGAFVTKQGTDGDSAYLLANGAPLTVDYSFSAELSFPELVHGGAFYMTAKKSDNVFVRFGIEVVSATGTVKVFSDYANGGASTDKMTHITLPNPDPVSYMGVIVYGDTVAMIWNGTMIYERTVRGMTESELVISGGKQMPVEIRNIKVEDDSAKIRDSYAEASNGYKAPLIGNTANEKKINEDRENGTVIIYQKNSKSDKPEFDFYHNGNALRGEAWAVRGTMKVLSSASSGQIFFIAKHDSSNYANLIINRRQNGSNGIWRSILVNGVRTPAKGNENLSNTLVDVTDWTAEFVYVFQNKTVSLYLKEEGEEFQFMGDYETEWDVCSARMQILQYVDVYLSNLQMTDDIIEVENLTRELDEKNNDQPKPLRILFIGNSATSVNDVPYTLLRLARKAGYNIEVTSWTKGGYELSEHADASTAYGQTVYHEISRQHDIVFLQENCNCITNDATRQATKDACKKLNDAILAAGSKTYIYVRPPYGYATAGYEPLAQCKELDKLFSEISTELGTTNAYVNRAFAYAIKNYNFNLWGSDNAHTSVYGAYLVVCVMFATLFETSATVLDCDGLPAEDALILQQIADKIVLEKYIPW